MIVTISLLVTKHLSFEKLTARPWSHSLLTLIRFVVNPSTRMASSSARSLGYNNYPFLRIFPFAPSPKVTWPELHGCTLVTNDFSPVMWQEHPLSKYQSSFEEDRREEKATWHLVLEKELAFLTLHSFLFLCTYLLELVTSQVPLEYF